MRIIESYSTNCGSWKGLFRGKRRRGILCGFLKLAVVENGISNSRACSALPQAWTLILLPLSIANT